MPYNSENYRKWYAQQKTLNSDTYQRRKEKARLRAAKKRKSNPDAHNLWLAKAKSLNSNAWKKYKERSIRRAPKYKRQRDEYRKWLQTTNPEQINEYSRKARYGNIQAADRPKPKHCEICGDNTKKICFDHCHQRGIFRGWICFHCNFALGIVKDDTNRLRQLIAYLERTKDLVPPQLSLPGI